MTKRTLKLFIQGANNFSISAYMYLFIRSLLSYDYRRSYPLKKQ